MEFIKNLWNSVVSIFKKELKEDISDLTKDTEQVIKQTRNKLTKKLQKEAEATISSFVELKSSLEKGKAKYAAKLANDVKKALASSEKEAVEKAMAKLSKYLDKNKVK